MRIAIATVQSPFVNGGAEMLAQGLLDAARRAGHEATIVTLPFRHGPEEEISRSMDMWAGEDFTRFDAYSPDRVICLKFPAYYLRHPHKRLWLLHQHRPAYDLRDRESRISQDLCDRIVREDTEHLGAVDHRHTISCNVSRRLRHYNRLDSLPLYPPLRHARRYYCGSAMPYIFFPSRLESLKRQELLIEAMKYVRSPVKALIAGTGGRFPHYAALIEKYSLSHKVRLLGEVSHHELLALYAHCLGVFFGPYDEDYGYVTLEAMLSAKPVITCSDSGGPIEFVLHGHTGFVTEPDPRQVAQAVEKLAANPNLAARMGRNGLDAYHGKNITWEHVLLTLLADTPPELATQPDSGPELEHPTEAGRGCVNGIGKPPREGAS